MKQTLNIPLWKYTRALALSTDSFLWRTSQSGRDQRNLKHIDINSGRPNKAKEKENPRVLKNEQIEIQITISSPLLCGSTRLIVSVLKYNQVAENSYDQQSNFVRGTIYINEMISISEQKLICKWREGWTACKAPRDEIWIFHSQDLWESTIHFKTNIWFGQTRRVSVNQLWNRYW